MGIGFIELVIIMVIVMTVVVSLVVVLVRAQGKGSTTPIATGSARALPRAAGQASKRANWLVARTGPLEGKTYHIGARTVTVGRKVGNYIQLLDEGVSRVHCQFRPTSGGGLEVLDKGSATGTFVNDARLDGERAHRLADGDQVRLGATAFAYYREADFPFDHGLTDQKLAGVAQFTATQSMGAVPMEAELAQKLDAAGGDVELAARQMGVSRELFEQMLKQAGVPYDA